MCNILCCCRCCRASICFSVLTDFLVNLRTDNVLIQQQIDNSNNSNKNNNKGDNNYQRSAALRWQTSDLIAMLLRASRMRNTAAATTAATTTMTKRRARRLHKFPSAISWESTRSLWQSAGACQRGAGGCRGVESTASNYCRRAGQLLLLLLLGLFTSCFSLPTVFIAANIFASSKCL